MQSESQNKRSIVLIIAFWLLVGIPLLWGVTNTVMTAMTLFN